MLPAEQAQILGSVEAFLAKRLPPAEIRRRDAGHVPPYDLLPEMGELGLFALAVPVAEGGLGADWATVALVQEALGQHAYMAASIFNRVVGFGLASIRAHGTAAQRAEMLPLLMAGRAFCALALTEPQAGSDAAAIRTRATRQAGGWRINGRKTWISDAEGARWLILPARTGPEKEGARGISLFLVPTDAPGIAMTPLPKVGNNCMPSFDIGLQDVALPEEALLGQEGQGFGHLMSTLHYSRASMAATVTGAAEAALRIALDHARTREQFGQPIGRFQAVAHRLVDMRLRVDQSRLMVRHLAQLIDAGAPCRREAAQAKIIATETLRDVADAGMQIMASAGYSAESDMQRLWRDSRLYTFGEGANEVLRDTIAREMGLTARGRA
ncbi:acyl-CoA dehydrogenase family protein [Falsiroseomonas tokyonensis]|uniref:Acyl-CoA dehydrogenase family protein n=1 Tax=Falsiroseomonas tokyonensis TaxID=430521 RepID=A0ABV7C4I5_9PROT|nr:acyl-CoA dehydrogenase family protein [Falsiroseomonas tokyonensis]MBU8541062.1 acyl-CoA/acyl-ACP dehydrogenase [Falsiroseomonas tokyonensis]